MVNYITEIDAGSRVRGGLKLGPAPRYLQFTGN
jgi:hypothetical protein